MRALKQQRLDAQQKLVGTLYRSQFHVSRPCALVKPSRQGSHRGARRAHKVVMAAAASNGDKLGMAGGEEEQRSVGKIVICGGGIIGAATAFYLAELGVGKDVTVVERDEIAAAASGKAGGFLALDWNDKSPMRSLSRVSYALHQDLAEIFGADRIGYRPVRTFSVAGVETPHKPLPVQVPGKQLLPKWVDGNVIAAASMGSEKTTAQVHPALLTKALVESAQQRGVQVVKAAVTGLELDGEVSKTVKGVRVAKTSGAQEEEVVPADVAVLAMGPWTDVAAANWGLPLPRVTGQKYHSIVMQTHPEFPAYSADCLFTQFEYASGREVEPEVYPRPDTTVYVCGEAHSVPVPPSASEVAVDESCVTNLVTLAHSLSGNLQKAQVVAKQACYLPLGPDASPIIGPVPGHPGAYVATGHSCWGILNGPASGKALAELIVTGKATTVDLKPFSPERFLRSPVTTASGRRVKSRTQ